MTITDTACILAVYFGVFSGIGLVLCLLEILFEKFPTLLRFACRIMDLDYPKACQKTQRKSNLKNVCRKASKNPEKINVRKGVFK